MITTMNDELQAKACTPSEPADYRANRDCAGFIKVWQFDPKTGKSWLVKEINNTILYGGADLLAYALAGKANSGISHMYVGFNNNASFDIAAEPAVTKGSTTFRTDGDYGYVRVPLTFPAAFQAQANYDHNTVFFTVMLTNPPDSEGAEFNDDSKIHTIGLCAALNPSGNDNDVIFSRAQFTPITYDPAFGLTVTWGVRFTAI